LQAEGSVAEAARQLMRCAKSSSRILDDDSPQPAIIATHSRPVTHPYRRHLCPPAVV